MADKQITVAVAEERVPEFYAWFASFLAADPSGPPGRGASGGRDRGGPAGGPGWAAPGRRGRAPHGHREVAAWSAQDADQAAWLYGRLAPPARQLFDLLSGAPGQHFAGNDIAARLGLEKGAHGVAGILAWPGRYSRKLGRVLPISTEGREDGGTDYYMAPDVAELFAHG